MRIWFVQEYNTVTPAGLTRRLLISDSSMQPIILPQLPIAFNTTYATLSSGISWNIPRVTCIFWCTHEPLGECEYQENTCDEWDPWCERICLSHQGLEFLTP